jgi:PPOX class probable F420-dependent enzyme
MSQHPPDPATPAGGPVIHHVYAPFALPDPATPVGQIIARRLRDEQLIWLTTIDEQSMPQPLPVTFLWDAAQATFLIYSRTDRGRLDHIQRNPNVALHFDVSAGDILIITGHAAVSPDDPPSDQLPAWVEKYRALVARLGMTAGQSAASASAPVRIRPLSLRYAPNPL